MPPSQAALPSLQAPRCTVPRPGQPAGLHTRTLASDHPPQAKAEAATTTALRIEQKAGQPIFSDSRCGRDEIADTRMPKARLTSCENPRQGGRVTAVNPALPKIVRAISPCLPTPARPGGIHTPYPAKKGHHTRTLPRKRQPRSHTREKVRTPQQIPTSKGRRPHHPRHRN